ncbi:MAG: hypothetical protein ACR2G6_11650 [Gemmatimonadaceae bacterium]
MLASLGRTPLHHRTRERLVMVRPDVRVIYMSGYTDDDILRRGLIDRRTAFIQKPFAVEELARWSARCWMRLS